MWNGFKKKLTAAELKLKSAAMDIKTHYVYIFQCECGKRYCGMTGHVINRFVAHATQDGARFTRAFHPISLLHLERLPSYYEAITKERLIKRSMRGKVDLRYSIVPEYQGIFVIILEMLKTHSGSYVKCKLNAIEQSERGVGYVERVYHGEENCR